MAETEQRELEMKKKVEEKNDEVRKWEKMNQELKNEVELAM